MVARIEYSPDAKQDLEVIGDYIAQTLQNPSAALTKVTAIQDRIDKLADFPKMGTLLSAIANIDTDYRFLVCGKYLAFYRYIADTVYIVRILYGKRDYLQILFSNHIPEAAEDKTGST